MYRKQNMFDLSLQGILVWLGFSEWNTIEIFVNG